MVARHLKLWERLTKQSLCRGTYSRDLQVADWWERLLVGLARAYSFKGVGIRRYSGGASIPEWKLMLGGNPLANRSTYQCVYYGWLYFAMLWQGK